MEFIDRPGIREQLYPFTLTRNIEDIRLGILTIKEKWEQVALEHSVAEVPSNLIPAFNIDNETFSISEKEIFLERPWHIFQYNADAIRHDFRILTYNRVSAPLSDTNKVIGTGKIFLEEGACIEHAIINTTDGPVYIGRAAEVMEGSMIRGPFAMCEGAVLKMGSRVYGGTTLGPYCVAGGEIKNSVLFGFSNKGHDGYLGDSVIGEWCNLGAGVSNSNLKNSAGDVKVYDMASGELKSAGMKCGLLMGDYSRAAINTSFNTGTVTGVASNIFCSGLTPKFIPSFSWGADGNEVYDFDLAMRDISNWKKLKKQELGEEEIRRLRHIFDNLKK